MRQLMIVAVVWIALGWIGRALVAARGETTLTVRIERETSVDDRIAFYHLVATDGIRATVSVDKAEPGAIARLLAQYDGQRVLLTVTPLTVERLDR